MNNDIFSNSAYDYLDTEDEGFESAVDFFEDDMIDIEDMEDFGDDEWTDEDQETADYNRAMAVLENGSEAAVSEADFRILSIHMMLAKFEKLGSLLDGLPVFCAEDINEEMIKLAKEQLVLTTVMFGKGVRISRGEMEAICEFVEDYGPDFQP